MAYKPGELIYDNHAHINRLFRLESFSLEDDEDWHLELKAVNHDGTSFGFTRHDRYIHHFEGVKPFTSLTAFPLEYHPNEKKIRNEHLQRGMKFVSLVKTGVQQKTYDGVVLFFRDVGPQLHPLWDAEQVSYIKLYYSTG